MTVEAPRPNNEAPKSVEFYNPITDRTNTLEKLTGFSKKEPTDLELFEAIADTFATMATIDFEAGYVSPDGFQAQEWRYTDELISNTKKFAPVFIGYHQLGGGEVISEEAFIEVVDDASNITSIKLERDKDGLMRVYEYDGEKDEDHPYEIPSNQRKVIVETLLEIMSPKQPVAV